MRRGPPCGAPGTWGGEGGGCRGLALRRALCRRPRGQGAARRRLQGRGPGEGLRGASSGLGFRPEARSSVPQHVRGDAALPFPPESLRSPHLRLHFIGLLSQGCPPPPALPAHRSVSRIEKPDLEFLDMRVSDTRLLAHAVCPACF